MSYENPLIVIEALMLDDPDLMHWIVNTNSVMFCRSQCLFQDFRNLSSLFEDNCLFLSNNIWFVDQPERSYLIRLCDLKICILACRLFKSLWNYQTKSCQIYFLNENFWDIIHHRGIWFNTSPWRTAPQLNKVHLIIRYHCVSSSFWFLYVLEF